MKDQLIIVTGMSGAGKTVVLNALEDMRYFVMDNVPHEVGHYLLKALENKEIDKQKVGLGIDIRSIGTFASFKEVVKRIRKTGIDLKVIYVDASDEVILGRYNLNRRKHPVDGDTLLESISKERQLMELVKEKVDYIIDTSNKSSKETVRLVEEIVYQKGDKNLTVHLRSFGFKYGNPRDMDMIFDVRCLPNPHYIEELRVKTGNDQEVRDYVLSFDVSKTYYNKVEELIKFLIPNFITEGKKHLSIGIGCSGGKHRSVTFINELYRCLSKDERLFLVKSHREEEDKNWGG